MIYFVSICNIAGAIVILVMWIRESRRLPRKFVRQMSLRYARFYLVFAMMMNRFIRFSLWAASVPGYTAIPYWPLTWAEKGIILAYLVLCVIGLVLYRADKSGAEESSDEAVYIPFNPLNLFYPTMMPGLKVAKGNTSIALLASLCSVIWVLGLLNILVTTLLALKNVR